MSLKERIDQDLKSSLLARDSLRTDTLRGLKAAVLNEEVASNCRDTGLADDAIEKVVAREVKKRHESATLYEQNGRQESAAAERAEAAILGEYLPKQLSEDEVRGIVREVIADIGAASAADMGKTIGAVKAKLGNSADGALIARVTKELLG